MADIYTYVAGAITIGKSLVELAKGIKNPQLQRELANLNKQLAEAESHEADMIREITSLKETLLEEKENPLTFTGVVYYDTHNIPYCPGCYGKSKRTERIPLSLDYSIGNYKQVFCSGCGTRFEEGTRPFTPAKTWDPLK